ncbi:CD5 antigen-like [Antedon mediterranea]|uniref:CD5 antigen-like n=1 Tax=Antedon mediterranea TaxID=105859 RepID=UPI003AF7DD58
MKKLKMEITLVFSLFVVSVQAETVRLVGGVNKYEGRVEVFRDGRWGTVCDNGWDFTAANVVCREVGFGNAVTNVFGQNPGDASQPILLHNVRCTGQELRLSDCPSKTGSGTCDHSEDISVRCSPVNDFDVRLVDGLHLNVGRLQVYRNGTWGQVCDRHWNDDSADVACRQLGYVRSDSWVESYKLKENASPIEFDLFQCTGSEGSLMDCVSHAWNENSDCGNTVKIQCSYEGDLAYSQGDSRFVGGDTTMAGILDVYIYGEWRTVCSKVWNKDEGKAVCKGHGYEGAQEHKGNPNDYNKSLVIKRPVHAYGIDCSGKKSLNDCHFKTDKLYIGCTHDDDVATTCGPTGLSGGGIAGIVIGSLFVSFFLYSCCISPQLQKRKRNAARPRPPPAQPNSTPNPSAITTSDVNIDIEPAAVPSAAEIEPPSYDVAVKTPSTFVEPT